MASDACDRYCCVAKRFDRPFRLPRASPSSSPPSTDAAAASDDGAVGEAVVVGAREEEEEVGAGERSAAVPGPTEDATEDATTDEETPEEEKTARARLRELLDAMPTREGSKAATR